MMFVRRFALLPLALAVGCTDGSETGDGDTIDAAPSADAAPAPLPDPCADQMPACPAAPASMTEGGGLVAIDRCAFPLTERDEWAARAGVVDDLAAALDQVGVAGVLDDLNRTAAPVGASALPGEPPGVRQAFGWQAGDMSVAYWIPQGIDGGRVDGRKVLLVSWYYDRASDPGSTVEKGVRIAIVDATDPASVRYRFALLVEPEVVDGRPSFGPVAVHAGGLAWVGRYLYVVHTGVGFRVFDLDRILRVDASQDTIGRDAATGRYHAHGYAYVVPQVDTIAHASACAPRFSFVSVDRTTNPPSLLSGEYDAASIRGRLYRWPLDPATGRLQVVGAGRVIAYEAWLAAHSHVQGALSLGDTVWLSSSKPAGTAGVLYRAKVGAPSRSFGWIDAPEDLAYDPGDRTMWSLSEGLNARYVVGIDADAVD